MLDESAYLETVRTESGVVVAVAYDDDASNDCPLDWIAGHVAVFVVDAPCIETARNHTYHRHRHDNRHTRHKGGTPCPSLRPTTSATASLISC